MAVSLVNFTDNAGGTMTEPASTQQGDMLICVMNGPSAAGGPAGWAKVGADRSASGETTNVWWIARGGSAPSYVWTNSPDGGCVASFRGAQTTLHASGQSAAGSAVSPSVTTTVDNAFMVLAYGDYASSAITAPSGCTIINAGFFLALATFTHATAGATPTKTWNSTVTPIGAWTIALAPLTYGPPPSTVMQRPNRIWRV